MLNNLIFLSQGVQLCLFFIVIAIVLVLMKMSDLTHRVENVEANMGKYVTNEDYMETFNNMFNAKVQGLDTSPYETFE